MIIEQKMMSKITSTLLLNSHRFIARNDFTALGNGIRSKATARRLGTFCRTNLKMEQITIKVPSMGDSITEGTIVEWTATVGQAVKEGDVIALVETDKVTIDIKSEMDGVIAAQFGDVDDNVEVGAELYLIDTDASATVKDASEEIAPDHLEEPAIAPTSAESFDDTSIDIERTRIPSIKFLGKEGWLRLRNGATKPEISSSTPEVKAISPKDTVTLDGSNLGPMYGRMAFTDREMEALIMGGASEAPSVKSGSTGAVFSV